MRFLKNLKFDPLEARTSGFTGSMGGKTVAGVVFGPKPTTDLNFIKIGVGDRTGVLHFLIFGLLRFGLSVCISLSPLSEYPEYELQWVRYFFRRSSQVQPSYIIRCICF